MGISRWYWSAALGGFIALVLLMIGLRWQVVAGSYSPLPAGTAAAFTGDESGAAANPDSARPNREQVSGSSRIAPAGSRPLLDRSGATAEPDTASGSGKKPGASKRREPAAKIPRLDLNHAGSAELQQLPGIGPVLANRIVSYRNLHGAFARYEDLDAVKGVGPKMLEKLRPYLYVGE